MYTFLFYVDYNRAEIYVFMLNRSGVRHMYSLLLVRSYSLPKGSVGFSFQTHFQKFVIRCRRCQCQGVGSTIGQLAYVTKLT